ncbi:hypothetical protein N7466_000234 [Penicillium verhagenii]|uniref:uncharacterized protein n=1 Tax=Penicillium verhagenii TaxID=1562060 RepID=UPI0025459D98|nr:uncharacterized protein N7466_000234 [Penicillium verhagenii]KAJ5947219.1 hypothetical protein N7466_000234 [Penicillium verhagenii]
MDLCESLYAALAYIDMNPPTLMANDSGCKQLKGNEATAMFNLIKWAHEAALPSTEFASFFDDTLDVTAGSKKARDESILKASLAADFLLLMKAHTDCTFPNSGATTSPDALITIATFNSEQDPWTTPNTRKTLDMYYGNPWPDLWNTIERVLKEKLRPLFTKQRNPNITNEGRKDFHPVPLPRFDGSALDDSAKPWKNTDIYATSVLSWIVSQYKPADKKYLEAHFPLLVPAILSLIDDSSIAFKVKGCQLLGHLIDTIKKCDSDILLRTNLIPVFEEAIKPCLLFLPTITPEDKSIKMLGAAYPVLIALFRAEQNEDNYKRNLVKILRSNLVTSFNHISSSAPASESSPSFPHPKLSTFLMDEISIVINELGIETIKYLQDIVPLLSVTLWNPFGSGYPPLLSAAVSTTKDVILNAHPRVWKWHGEILAGLCSCWLHISEENKAGGAGQDSTLAKQLSQLSRELQGAVSMLKHALQNPKSPSADQILLKERLDGELQKLVDADSELAELLFVDSKS